MNQVQKGTYARSLLAHTVGAPLWAAVSGDEKLLRFDLGGRLTRMRQQATVRVGLRYEIEYWFAQLLCFEPNVRLIYVSKMKIVRQGLCAGPTQIATLPRAMA